MALKKKGSPAKLTIAKQSDLDKWLEIIKQSLAEDFGTIVSKTKTDKK